MDFVITERSVDPVLKKVLRFANHSCVDCGCLARHMYCTHRSAYTHTYIHAERQAVHTVSQFDYEVSQDELVKLETPAFVNHLE